mmetsp:Transcript_13373/g.30474  ORF Transcript_13373/g.30474 Transcript_13373/m.30474 type:complete len:224 (-) Transcript_13373:182-853(-)
MAGWACPSGGSRTRSRAEWRCRSSTWRRNPAPRSESPASASVRCPGRLPCPLPHRWLPCHCRRTPWWRRRGHWPWPSSSPPRGRRAAASWPASSCARWPSRRRASSEASPWRPWRPPPRCASPRPTSSCEGEARRPASRRRRHRARARGWPRPRPGAGPCPSPSRRRWRRPSAGGSPPPSCPSLPSSQPRAPSPHLPSPPQAGTLPRSRNPLRRLRACRPGRW